MAKASKQALREEINALRRIGAQFANLAYNISQMQPSPFYAAKLKELQEQWDAIPRSQS